MLKELPVIGVVGAGALGAYYGGLLGDLGCQVNYLVRSNLELLKKEGFTIESYQGDFKPKNLFFYDSTKEFPHCDYLILTTKSTSNNDLIKLIPDLIGENTLVVNFQNGIGFEEELEAEIPNIKVISVLCFICAFRISATKIVHTDYGKVSIGNDYRYHDDVKKLNLLFLNSKIESKIDVDRRLGRWKKLVWNIPYNGMCTLYKAKTDYFSTEEKQAEIRSLMKEVQCIARVDGFEITDSFIENMIESTLKMKPYKPSMLLDLENSRPLELEYMYKRVLDLAEQKKVCLRKIKELYNKLVELNL